MKRTLCVWALACGTLLGCRFGGTHTSPPQLCIDLADYAFFKLGCDQDAAAPGCESFNPMAEYNPPAMCPSAAEAQAYVDKRFHVTPEGTDVASSPDAHPAPYDGQCCY